jgi:uncharacterized protein (TIRG00374 family)
MKHKLSRKILISLALGLILYIALSIWADINSLLNALSVINLWLIPLILLLVLINYVIRFIKWDFYLEILNIDIQKIDSIGIFFSGLSMSITPGKMGELLKCYILKKIKKIPLSYSAPIIIAERITDFISLIIIAIIGAYTIGLYREIVIIFGVLFIGLVFIIGSRIISLKILSILEKIRIINKYMKKIHTAYESIYILVKIKPLFLTTSISLIGWFCECFAVYLVVYSFGLKANMLVISFIYSFSTLVGSVSFLPGGLGLTEVSLVGLLILKGTPEVFSVAITFITRAVTLWFAVILGSITLLIYQRRIDMHIEEIENIENVKEEIN